MHTISIEARAFWAASEKRANCNLHSHFLCTQNTKTAIDTQRQSSSAEKKENIFGLEGAPIAAANERRSTSVSIRRPATRCKRERAHGGREAPSRPKRLWPRVARRRRREQALAVLNTSLTRRLASRARATQLRASGASKLAIVCNTKSVCKRL